MSHSNLAPEGEALIESILRRVVAGDVTDADRVVLYRLALTSAAAEFHRIASNGHADLIAPEVLILLQQIHTLCDPRVSADRIRAEAEKIIGPIDAEEESLGE